MMEDPIDIIQNLIMEVMKNANDFSDQELASFLSLLQDALEMLVQSSDQATDQAPLTNVQQSITPGQYPSSQINGFKYDPKQRKLLIQYHGPYPQAAGPVYSYDDVPEFIFNILQSGRVGPKTSGQNRYHKWQKGVTPSLGGAVNALIKSGGFKYSKIS